MQNMKLPLFARRLDSSDVYFIAGQKLNVLVVRAAFIPHLRIIYDVFTYSVIISFCFYQKFAFTFRYSSANDFVYLRHSGKEVKGRFHFYLKMERCFTLFVADVLLSASFVRFG